MRPQRDSRGFVVFLSARGVFHFKGPWRQLDGRVTYNQRINGTLDLTQDMDQFTGGRSMPLYTFGGLRKRRLTSLIRHGVHLDRTHHVETSYKGSRASLNDLHTALLVFMLAARRHQACN